MRNSINRSEKSSIKPPIFSGRSTISCSSKGRGDLPSNRARNLPFSKTASDFDETRKRKNTELPELRLQKLDSISKYSGVSYDQTRSFSGSTYSGSADTSLVREKISFPSRESFPGRAVPPLSQTRSFSGKISGENGIFFKHSDSKPRKETSHCHVDKFIRKFRKKSWKTTNNSKESKF
eukprot:GHVP01054258.1.p1 GENE.GHVP01054258.1~~GHVP01054258.1.p1  ORF type:complete len:179 (+),score=28.71 GHVP01054258.1:70-606(+)